MFKIIAWQHVTQVHYLNSMSAIFVINSSELRYLHKSKLKRYIIYMALWHQCYFCT